MKSIVGKRKVWIPGDAKEMTIGKIDSLLTQIVDSLQVKLPCNNGDSPFWDSGHSTVYKKKPLKSNVTKHGEYPDAYPPKYIQITITVKEI